MERRGSTSADGHPNPAALYPDYVVGRVRTFDGRGLASVWECWVTPLGWWRWHFSAQAIRGDLDGATFDARIWAPTKIGAARRGVKRLDGIRLVPVES
jgi:hypothetical protein